MGYFQVRYDSRVVIYERKMFIRLQQIWQNFTTLAKFSKFQGLISRILKLLGQLFAVGQNFIAAVNGQIISPENTT